MLHRIDGSFFLVQEKNSHCIAHTSHHALPAVAEQHAVDEAAEDLHVAGVVHDTEEPVGHVFVVDTAFEHAVIFVRSNAKSSLDLVRIYIFHLKIIA